MAGGWGSYLRAANVPLRLHRLTFAGCTEDTSSTAAKLQTWAQKKDALLQRPGVVLIGKSGTGKTGLGISTLQLLLESESRSRWERRVALLRRGRSFDAYPMSLWYTTWGALNLQLLKLSPQDRAVQVCRLQYIRCLFLDDLDADTLTPFREAIILSLLERITHNRRLIVTMNRDPREVFTDRVAERLLDRSSVVVCKLTGNSRRTGAA